MSLRKSNMHTEVLNNIMILGFIQKPTHNGPNTKTSETPSY